jgi:tRNA(Ile2) C34 agmatinyltransferase TiaS
MFEKLKLIVRCLTRGTQQTWCMKCRSQRTVIKLRRVKIHTAKRISTRQIGTCLTCRGQTSSFVRAA